MNYQTPKQKPDIEPSFILTIICLVILGAIFVTGAILFW